MTNRNKNNELTDRYEGLLDKYMDNTHVNFSTQKECEEEARKRYGDLVDRMKPGNSAMELIAQLEEEQMERRKERARDEALGQQWSRECIERVRQREQKRMEENADFTKSIIDRKEARIKAAEEKERQERMAAEKQQEFCDRIDGLMSISPECAEAHLQVLKKWDLL